MPDTPAADRPDAPDAPAMRTEPAELLDGTPTVRAWVIALAVVWLQVSALLWGLSVLP